MDNDGTVNSYIGGSVASPSWNLGGGGTGNYDYIEGYTVTSTSGKVNTISAGDFNKDVISFYGVLDAPGHVFTVSYGAFSASTTFNIKKPGQSIYNGSFTASGLQNTPTIDATPADGPGEDTGSGIALQDQMLVNATIPVSEWPNVEIVQLANLHYAAADITGEGTAGGFYTDGDYWLDGGYPYPWQIQGSTWTDTPYLPLPWYRTIAVVDASFEDTLMWKPPGYDSIYVPIQDWSWSWTGRAVWNAGSRTWDLRASSPTFPPPQTSQTINGAYTDTYPTWDHVLKKQ